MAPPKAPPIAGPTAPRTKVAMCEVARFGEKEGERDLARPCRGQDFFEDTQPFIGMDEAVGCGQDPDVFGDGARHHAEQDQRAGWGIGGCDLRHHRSRAFGQNLTRAALAPVPTVGRDRERFRPHHLAPDATGQTEAVTTDALDAGLVVVGRAKPGPRDGDDRVGIGSGHSTAPSCPPSTPTGPTPSRRSIPSR